MPQCPAPPDHRPEGLADCVALLTRALDWCDAHDAGFAAIHISQAIETLGADPAAAAGEPPAR